MIALNENSKIYIAGHRGLVGSAIFRNLQTKGYEHLVTRTSEELDLRDQQQVDFFFKEETPEYIFLSAAKVGGIVANATYPAEFLYDNLMIQSNIIEAARKYKVKKLLFLGSTCIYPKNAPQPLKESYLLTSELEPTNEPYAIAKIAGIKMCKAYNKQYGTNFISVMPTNLYGPNDNFNLETSHVLPALMRKIYEAKANKSPDVTIWGTGAPLREFLYVDDLADACVYLMQNFEYEDIGEFVNIGTGNDITIHELAKILCSVIGYEGQIAFDHSKPDGTPKKVTDVSIINKLGWQAKIDLKTGIETTYEWFKQNNLD